MRLAYNKIMSNKSFINARVFISDEEADLY